MNKKAERKQFVWRLPTPCDECPFNATGVGRSICDSLAVGRMQGILDDLATGGTFMCHKTTPQTGNNTKLVCAGALDWKLAHSIPPSEYEAWCVSLEMVKESKNEMIKRFKALAKTRRASVSRENGRPSNPNT